MNYQEFQYHYRNLDARDPRFRSLCNTYPHYAQIQRDRSWAAIAKIRARKQDTKTIDSKEPIV